MIEFEKHIRDPIHGFIGLTKEEVTILDTTPMQRLRRIKQLANAHLLYPGANHTRFEHSLGAMHLSYRMGLKLEFTIDNLRLLRISTLLHDIAHGPYSHPFEDAMQELGKDYDHDKVRIDVIQHEPIIKDDHLKDQVISFLKNVNGYKSDQSPDPEWKAMKMILSSPLDCDKMDYLLRDGYYCGVNYSKFDLERILLKICYIRDKPYDTKLLAIDINGSDAASMVTICRLMMNRQVYLHKLRAISDLMTKRMIYLATTDSKFLSADNGYDIYKRFSGFSDYSLIDDIIMHEYHPLSRMYAQSLKDRKLFKVVRKINIDDISETGKEELLRLEKDKKKRREFFNEFERELGEIIGEDPNNIIIDYHESHVKKPSGETYIKDGDKKRSLSEISPIDLKDEDKLQKNVYILVRPDVRDLGIENVEKISI